uniref:Uncharacterized protein n=2 Tax=Caenorhabditis japonica TaxID=281687 RepID=A0A8R1IM24_CAEJA
FDVPSTSGTGAQPANNQPSVLSRLGHVASTSSMRRFAADDGQSVGDLGSVFNDVMSVTSLAEGSDDPLFNDEFRDEEEEPSGGIWQKCDTKYMYQSFALEPSEAGSEIGSPRRKQFLELGLPEKGDDEDLTLL